MHPLTTIHKLNREAAEADLIMRKHRYLETLTEDQQFAFKQLGEDMQRLIVNENITNRIETNLEKR